MRYLVGFLLFVIFDLAVYFWLHDDLDERLLRSSDVVSTNVYDLGDLQERVIFKR